MVRIVYRHATHRTDITGGDRARFIHADGERRLGDIVVQSDDERLEILNDLMHVLDHALDRLVLMHNTVDAECPNRGSAEGREKNAPHRVSERMAKTTLKRLDHKFRTAPIF